MSRRSTGTSRKPDADSTPTRRLIVSFHDLHPGSRTTGERCLRLLAELGIDRATWLVVPRWYGGPPCTDDAAFTAWLRELASAGHEIALHGFTHRAETVTGGPLDRLIGRRYTAGEGEFFQITRAEATRRVHEGLVLLGRRAHLPVYGFTPPAWLLSPDGRAALRDAGLYYTTRWGAVELLRDASRLAAPTLVYSCRSGWRRLLSCAWVRVWHQIHQRAPILRVAIHPGDFDHAALIASLRRQLERAVAAGRTPSTYRDLLPADITPVSVPAHAAA